jgi:hypothetical protein
MNPLTPYLLWIKIGACVLVVGALVGSGIWFRGVLAENKELKTVTDHQKKELEAGRAEIAGMYAQAARDRVTLEQAATEKNRIAVTLGKTQRELRAARERLDEQLRTCFDTVLPADYLDRLPKAPGATDHLPKGTAPGASGQPDAIP